jgi:hypothetical protein
MRGILMLCLAAMPIAPTHAGSTLRSLAWSVASPLCNPFDSASHTARRGSRFAIAPPSRPGIAKATGAVRGRSLLWMNVVGSPGWEDVQRDRALVSTEWLAQNLEDVALLDVRGAHSLSRANAAPSLTVHGPY